MFGGVKKKENEGDDENKNNNEDKLSDIGKSDSSNSIKSNKKTNK